MRNLKEERKREGEQHLLNGRVNRHSEALT